MSKYIKSKEEINIDKVEYYLENHCKLEYELIEEKAREAAQRALETIKHYKETSYEDLAKAEEKEFEEMLKELIEHTKENPSIIDSDLEREIVSTLNNKSTPEKYKEARKIVAGLSPEEKYEKWLKITKERLDENLQESKKHILETDILYDLMTEEQIEKYMELVYRESLKARLERLRTDVIMHYEAAPKVFGKDAFAKDGSTDNHIFEVEDSARKIVFVEEKKQKNQIDKDDVIEKIKDGLGYLTGASILGLGAGSVSALIAELAGNSDLSMNLFKASPLFIAAILACCGVPTIKEFIKNKQAIAQAKRVGLYDLMIEHFQAEKDVNDYIEELKDIHAVEAKMGGMTI